MLKLLIGLNLTLLAGLLAITLLSWGTDLYQSAVWWRAAKANEAEWRACESKHNSLTRQIKKEGLWRRLGMPGQPWLQ